MNWQGWMVLAGYGAVLFVCGPWGLLAAVVHAAILLAAVKR